MAGGEGEALASLNQQYSPSSPPSPLVTTFNNQATGFHGGGSSPSTTAMRLRLTAPQCINDRACRSRACLSGPESSSSQRAAGSGSGLLSHKLCPSTNGRSATAIVLLRDGCLKVLELTVSLREYLLALPIVCWPVNRLGYVANESHGCQPGSNGSNDGEKTKRAHGLEGSTEPQ